jgi:heat shock protein HtpX
MKRVLLFVLTNVAVIVVVSIVARLLGLDRALEANGANWSSVLAFCALFGFGGAFFSLLISKWSAKRMMGVRIIEQPANSTEQWLVDTVRAQSQQMGIGMPEVGIFDSPEPNAFATGASKDKALVAVSTGLMQRMNRQEVEAVLGHEVGHVANGDMVTLTLIQGVVNTFVMFFARVVGQFVDRAILKNENGHGVGYFVTVIVAEIVFGLLASIIVAWFSRQREFRADSAGARLAGTNSMVGALEALKRVHEPQALPDKMAAFGISGGVPSGFKKLFMSHPPLDERIAALRNARIG